MWMKKILIEYGAKNLRAALSITTELRLKCYQRQGRQKEALPTVPQLSLTEEKQTSCSFTTAIVRLYQSLVPLISGLSQILRKTKNVHDSLVTALQNEIFFDVSPMTTAKAYLRVLQLSKAFDCLLSAKYSALVHYKKSLEIREILFLEDPIREDIATVLYNMARTQIDDERPKDALKTLEKLLPLRNELLTEGGVTALRNHAAALILRGNCHIAEPDKVQQAKDAYEEAEKVLERLPEGQSKREYAVLFYNLGEFNS